uniref:Uncharacterized protein n=1 Tax=Panagrolaimus superbus TaxID=310955 RepID=A0A914Y7P0_9BILA
MAHPLTTLQNLSKTAINIPSETPKTTINLLSKPLKVAERVYFTPTSQHRSNTVKLTSSSKEQLFKLLNNSSRFNTLPTNFTKLGISPGDIKKYMNEEMSSDDETDSEYDSDEFELSTLCTDSDADSVCYYENVSSEPSSLHTNSEDSDADCNKTTLKRNTFVASSKAAVAEELFDDNDYIAFLQSLPKE